MWPTCGTKMDKPLLTKPTNPLVSAFAVSWLGREYSNTHHLSFNFAVLKVETGLSLAKRFAVFLPASRNKFDN